ncbi:WD40 repeat-like protein [Clavulina sp. PMI_390]|nr:WD40 repeat-like protein [Clavulina sp. PMI_390]
MIPILLQGHQRSLTQIKYNKEGDLLFTCSKDSVVNVWYSHNGERLGTYEGHNGSVWTCDVDIESKFLITGAADNTMRLWEVQTGKCLYIWEFPTAVKRVAFNASSSHLVCTTEARMGHSSFIRIFELNRESPTSQSKTPVREWVPHGAKPTVVAFAEEGECVVSGHEDGRIVLWDTMLTDDEYTDLAAEELESAKVHTDTINDMQMSPDRSYFITASKDKTAKLHVTSTLKTLKTYPTETPLNSASIATLKPYVLVGGGQDAMSVTTTSLRQGKFETRFWHKLFEEEVGRVKGHFGPINTIAVHPSGRSYASGGEDGFVRVHHFDESYFRGKPYGDVGEILE